MILGTRNCLTSMCKNLHTFIKINIKNPLSSLNHPKCKPNTSFLIKIYSLRK